MNNIGEAFSARETAAVVGVLRDSNVVTVSGDREALAQAILSAVKAVRYSGLRLSALMSDGSPVNVVIIDKGDATPGFDAEGNRFEALTTYIRLNFANPYGPDDRLVMEDYMQTDFFMAEGSGDVQAFRMSMDRAHMESMGLDLGSLFAALGKL